MVYRGSLHSIQSTPLFPPSITVLAPLARPRVKDWRLKDVGKQQRVVFSSPNPISSLMRHRRKHFPPPLNRRIDWSALTKGGRQTSESRWRGEGGGGGGGMVEWRSKKQKSRGGEGGGGSAEGTEPEKWRVRGQHL